MKLDLIQNTSGTYAGFDRFGRVADHYWINGAVFTDVDRFKYGYDAAGNRTWREDAVAAANSKDFDEFYAYDGLHRLKTVERGNLTGGPPPTGVSDRNFQQQWGLDQLGNWPVFKIDANGDGVFTGSTEMDQTRTHNAANEIGTIGQGSGQADWFDPEHDAAGNMTLAGLPGDSYEYPWELTYDAWNRLVSRTESFSVYQYRYDGLHRRIFKDIPFTNDDVDYYYNEQWQLLEERVGGSSNPRAQYVWHPYYIDALAARYWDSNSDGDYFDTNEGRHYYIQDANYNVTAVLNDAGTVLERYNYTPYGEVTFLNPNFSVKTPRNRSHPGVIFWEN